MGIDLFSHCYLSLKGDSQRQKEERDIFLGTNRHQQIIIHQQLKCN